MTRPIFTLDAVSYRYPDAPAPALDAVTLTVEEGEFVLLAGLSASGKTTLLGVASGVIPHFHGGSFDGRRRAIERGDEIARQRQRLVDRGAPDQRVAPARRDGVRREAGGWPRASPASR